MLLILSLLLFFLKIVIFMVMTMLSIIAVISLTYLIFNKIDERLETRFHLLIEHYIFTGVNNILDTVANLLHNTQHNSETRRPNIFVKWIKRLDTFLYNRFLA